MSVRDRTKGDHYIQQLDQARCDANWGAVPELTRKIKKHAPHRTCLILTAEAEYAVVQATGTRPTTARPFTARPSTASSQHNTTLSRHIPLLLEAIERERTYVEDDFQARVCLGWIHWQLGEPALAATRLPRSIEQEFSQLDGTNKDSAEWTKVCALKASYIKGASQEQGGAVTEAFETFDSSLPILTSLANSQRQNNELRLWTELFLTSFCMISSYVIKSRISTTLETETLSAFRAWAKFWDSQGSSPVGGRSLHAEVSRRKVWGEYYLTVSELLQQDLPFSTTSLTAVYAQTSTRSQQRAELKRVEARYEALLLSEVQFPKAEETSEEVETFVELVMHNWRILCGSSWKEHDLGEGGAEAVSRGVLDILYRAATKTFHSTAILRDLFTVHLAVAEFELAFKAFDTYMDIVKKGKARIDKTGEPEPGLDDDETVLMTASECIKALCRYGSRQGAEKARDLGQFFEDWLDKHHPIRQPNGNGVAVENGHVQNDAPTVSPTTFALTWRCIGIGYAQWARLTYDGTARSDIQMRAIRCFRKSLLPQFQSTSDVETLFALGTILAERRELPAAIDSVKSGLQVRSTAGSATSPGFQRASFARERSLIPLWHLLALLMSARQEFLTAARSCEGAFEQFRDPKVLFGESDTKETYRSAHLNEKAHRHRGIVDDMDDFERESVLEVKMTQLALVEVLEGPEVAVNASDELLSLYTRLFGGAPTDIAPRVSPPVVTAAPPKSSAGTIKSITGGIFRRRSRSRTQTNLIPDDNVPSMPRPRTAQPLMNNGAPTIQVTAENGHRPPTRDKLQKRSNSLSKSTSVRGRSASVGRMRSLSGANNSRGQFFGPSPENQNGDPALDQNLGTKVMGGTSYPPRTTSMISNLSNGRRSSESKRLTQVPLHQMSQKEIALKAAAYNHDSEKMSDALPQAIPYSTSINPVTRFPRDQERRRRSAILVKVWLLISGFYRRASMYDDAKGAIEEAHKLVQELEADVVKDTTGTVSIDKSGWGGGKCVAALWGDVYTERGNLAIAEELPYAALEHFERALTNFPDHPSATVGLSNILLDIYSEELLPPPTIPNLVLPGPPVNPSVSTVSTASTATTLLATQPLAIFHPDIASFPSGPLGLPSSKTVPVSSPNAPEASSTPDSLSSGLKPSYKESSTALLDRLAARDRAYGLLNALTKLGTGWNNSEAWFALARAYEEGGQLDKAKEVLWWCVELEEGRGVRDWGVVGVGGYVL